MASKKGADSGRQEPLKSKEMGLYRDLLKLYDDKSYKKAIKVADNILKKYPDHGETLALKGVCSFNIGLKPAGYELLKLAARNDLK